MWASNDPRDFNPHKDRVDLDPIDCGWLIHALDRGGIRAENASASLHQRLEKLTKDGWLEWLDDRGHYAPTDTLRRNREGIDTLRAMLEADI